MRDLIEDLEGHLDEAAGTLTKATCRAFLAVLTSKATQYDSRAARKPGHSIYAMAHYLKGIQGIENAMGGELDMDTPESLEKMKNAIGKFFIVGSFPPAKNVIKQIDAYIKSGKLPKLRG